MRTISAAVRTARSACEHFHKPARAPLRTLVWGFLCQAVFYPHSYFFRISRSFLRSVSLFDRRPFLRPDLPCRRDAARSCGQGWPVFGPPPEAARNASLTAASTVSRCTGRAAWIVLGARRRGATPGRSEGGLWSGRRVSSPHNLVCGEPCEGSTMMQSCASATGSGAAGPFYKTGTTARVRIGAPPPRIVWARHRHGRLSAERVNSCPPWNPLRGFGRRGRGGRQAAFSTTPPGTSPVCT